MNTFRIRRFVPAVLTALMTLSIIPAAGALPTGFVSPAGQTPQERYVQLWGATAVREMYRSGVPASITLAQGILESRSGLSALAAEGHNHFGIKCHTDWKGKTMHLDDDARGECFRVYDSADQSFRDHSDFLRYRDRYKFLFDFDTEDYESWAYGLKKAGYATDPSYAAKLIKIIEDYGLSRFDRMTAAEAEKLGLTARELREAEESAAKAGAYASADTKDKKASKSSKRKKSRQAANTETASVQPSEELDRRARRKLRNQQSDDGRLISEHIPEPPNTIERAKRVPREAAEEFHFSLTRQVYELNGVAFVYAIEGETYASIASAYHLFPKEILRINDLAAETRLLEGTVVYIQQKKTQAGPGLEKYIVEEDGERLRDICQRFAVRQKSVEKINGFRAGHQLRAGDTVLLRK